MGWLAFPKRCFGREAVLVENMWWVFWVGWQKFCLFNKHLVLIWILSPPLGRKEKGFVWGPWGREVLPIFFCAPRSRHLFSALQTTFIQASLSANSHSIRTSTILETVWGSPLHGSGCKASDQSQQQLFHGAFTPHKVSFPCQRESRIRGKIAWTDGKCLQLKARCPGSGLDHCLLDLSGFYGKGCKSHFPWGASCEWCS